MVIQNMYHSLIANEVLGIWHVTVILAKSQPLTKNNYPTPSWIAFIFTCEDTTIQGISWYDDMEIPWFVTFLFHSVDIASVKSCDIFILCYK